ncbi:hypothetical protein DL89DRAFT_295243 [Linderina pennispora]|uniref:Uncharacterized protein n=1 Tax=Linderina pennispora TaxID=61395 RepID=A0A1Y1W050_9FUNG|nr:uncharacterized protein DL89DRAFT_295243 [Linderina pennispora]ORX66891.1 hypothetical protein DL89DRAFT_295243 [Linderina pennispora]
MLGSAWVGSQRGSVLRALRAGLSQTTGAARLAAGIPVHRPAQQARHISIEPQSPPATAKNAAAVEAIKEEQAVVSPEEASCDSGQHSKQLAVPLPPLLRSFALAAVAGRRDSAVSDSLVEKFGSDLQSIDNSIGTAKRRVRRWFGSGQMWHLIDTAIADRTFEEAELAMVHATGRLNESLQGLARQLAHEARGVENVGRQEPVERFALARRVWRAQQDVADAEFVERIPAYVRWSLAQFWAIGGVGVAGAVAGAAVYGVPAVYASLGGFGAVVMAFVWLGRRWSWLERLREDLLHVFRAEVRSALDAPVIDAVESSPLIRKA